MQSFWVQTVYVLSCYDYVRTIAQTEIISLHFRSNPSLVTILVIIIICHLWGSYNSRFNYSSLSLRRVYLIYWLLISSFNFWSVLQHFQIIIVGECVVNRVKVVFLLSAVTIPQKHELVQIPMTNGFLRRNQPIMQDE